MKLREDTITMIVSILVLILLLYLFGNDWIFNPVVRLGDIIKNK